MSMENTIVKLGRFPFRCTRDDGQYAFFKGWFWLDGSVGEPFRSALVLVEKDGEEYSASLSIADGFLNKSWESGSLDSVVSCLEDWFNRDRWSFELWD